jgi:type I restriction enzyme S subunit
LLASQLRCLIATNKGGSSLPRPQDRRHRPNHPEEGVLIELLQEKRQALITQAVTKGLDACVPMKDSGVEWLGPVPEHWGVLPIKLVARVGNGSTPNRQDERYWIGGTYPWLNSSVVNAETAVEASDFVTDLALRECHPPKISPPAVLVGITGEGRTRGMATTLLVQATINQHLAYLKPLGPNLEVRYLRRVLDSAYSHLRDESEGGGSTKGAITYRQLGDLKVPMPPVTEQRAIADVLRRETTEEDRLVEAVEATVLRLRDYRQALISAAVTGQIDVSNEAA